MAKSRFLTLAILLATLLPSAPEWTAAQDKAKEGSAKDLKGPIRTGKKTGHVSNYDEAKVKPYSLPDPLTLANGQPVRDAESWYKQRRPEILKLFETEIFGRVPPNAP